MTQTTQRTGRVIEMEQPGVQKQGIMRQLKLKNASISVNSDQMGKGLYFFPLQIRTKQPIKISLGSWNDGNIINENII